MEEEFDNAIDIDEQTENLKNISLKTPSNNRWRFLFDFNTSCFCKVRNHSPVLFTISQKLPDFSMKMLNSFITVFPKKENGGEYTPRLRWPPSIMLKPKSPCAFIYAEFMIMSTKSLIIIQETANVSTSLRLS